VVDIYDYVEQVRAFWYRYGEPELRQPELRQSYPVQADLVMKFRAVTGSPVLEAKRFLSQFPPERQGEYLAAAERYSGQELHDPVEDDPEIRPLFAAICEEARQDVEVWYQQRQEYLAASSPAVAGVLAARRGWCYRYWARVKELMRERHNIDWKTPAEMNPGIIFH
jgi:hypothetical protein